MKEFTSTSLPFTREGGWGQDATLGAPGDATALIGGGSVEQRRHGDVAGPSRGLGNVDRNGDAKV